MTLTWCAARVLINSATSTAHKIITQRNATLRSLELVRCNYYCRVSSRINLRVCCIYNTHIAATISYRGPLDRVLCHLSTCLHHLSTEFAGLRRIDGTSGGNIIQQYISTCFCWGQCIVIFTVRYVFNIVTVFIWKKIYKENPSANCFSAIRRLLVHLIFIWLICKHSEVFHSSKRRPIKEIFFFQLFLVSFNMTKFFAWIILEIKKK